MGNVTRCVLDNVLNHSVIQGLLRNEVDASLGGKKGKKRRKRKASQKRVSPPLWKGGEEEGGEEGVETPGEEAVKDEPEESEEEKECDQTCAEEGEKEAGATEAVQPSEPRRRRLRAGAHTPVSGAPPASICCVGRMPARPRRSV